MAFGTNIQSIYEELRKLLETKPKLLVLGIGENRMGDDGVGPYVSFEMDQSISNPRVKIINGGIVPEERLSEILDFQPNLIVIIDAIDSNELKGTVKLYEEKIMLNYLPISSHSMPLPVFIDRCKRGIEGVEIKLLGIRPFSMQFLETYELYKENEFSLDDKDENLNIPFYAFNLSNEMVAISKELIEMFQKLLKIE